MLRRIIKIDQEKCNGCGLCVTACHESAIGLVDNKAVLLRDDYCDGLGDCLPACPVDAIRFEEREALPFDKKAVLENMKNNGDAGGCPGSGEVSIKQGNNPGQTTETAQSGDFSHLRQWPVQIKLVNPQAGFLKGADLLVAADCTAYACGNFHQRFMKDKVTFIGCPKLDDTDYSSKLKAVIDANGIRHITVVKMEVPCCTGLAYAVQQAVEENEETSVSVVTIGVDGTIMEEGM